MAKEPKLENPNRGGCMHCPGNHELLEMDTELYQGFGGYMVTKDDKLFYMGDPQGEWGSFKTLANIEQEACREPNADWRVHLDLPLRDAVWQRHGPKEWVLIKTGLGFA
jgi:hypothetical protein